VKIKNIENTHARGQTADYLEIVVDDVLGSLKRKKKLVALKKEFTRGFSEEYLDSSIFYFDLMNKIKAEENYLRNRTIPRFITGIQKKRFVKLAPAEKEAIQIINSLRDQYWLIISRRRKIIGAAKTELLQGFRMAERYNRRGKRKGIAFVVDGIGLIRQELMCEGISSENITSDLILQKYFIYSTYRFEDANLKKKKKKRRIYGFDNGKIDEHQ
jgi:hypothetical protein